MNEPVSPARRGAGGWRAALREFAVIVAGVLAALAAQAWWEGRSERTAEAGYLRQLMADTRENEVRLQAAIAEDSAAAESARALMRALHDDRPLPPADSLLRWFNELASASDFQPVTGTYRALLGTGDLRLVRTDTLRTLLTAYAASVDAQAERLEQLRGSVLNLVGTGARHMPFLRRAFSSGISPEDFAAARLRGNDDALAVLFAIQAANINRLNGLRRLRHDTQRLRNALEAERSLR